MAAQQDVKVKVEEVDVEVDEVSEEAAEDSKANSTFSIAVTLDTLQTIVWMCQDTVRELETSKVNLNDEMEELLQLARNLMSLLESDELKEEEDRIKALKPTLPRNAQNIQFKMNCLSKHIYEFTQTYSILTDRLILQFKGAMELVEPIKAANARREALINRFCSLAEDVAEIWTELSQRLKALDQLTLDDGTLVQPSTLEEIQEIYENGEKIGFLLDAQMGNKNDIRTMRKQNRKLDVILSENRLELSKGEYRAVASLKGSYYGNYLNRKDTSEFIKFNISLEDFYAAIENFRTNNLKKSIYYDQKFVMASEEPPNMDKDFFVAKQMVHFFRDVLKEFKELANQRRLVMIEFDRLCDKTMKPKE